VSAKTRRESCSRRWTYRRLRPAPESSPPDRPRRSPSPRTPHAPRGSPGSQKKRPQAINFGAREIVAHLAALDYVRYYPPEWLLPVDHFVLVILAPLAAVLLLSGLDDLVVDAAWLCAWLKRKLWPAPDLYPPGERLLDTAPKQLIAILVPLW